MKEKRAFGVVWPVAEQVVGRLGAACERIEIAGSLRRRCEVVGDIEIVAVPRFRQQSFWGGAAERSMVDDLLDGWQARVGRGYFRMGPNGQRMKRFWVSSKKGEEFQVDLFLQPDPATWGMNFMIRTGSAGFSKKMVTIKRAGGWMPNDLRLDGALVWRGLERLETPEEEDVFRLWGMEVVPPEERNVE